MKYRLNSLPVKTTNNFQINDVLLDLEKPTGYSFHDFIIKGDTSKLKINTSIKEENIDSRIGLSFDKYYSIEIVVPKDVKISSPVYFTYLFSKNDSLIDCINIIYEENSKADFIIQYISEDEGEHFHHLKEVVHSKNNSNGSISVLNFLNQNSYHFYSLEEDISLHSQIINNIIDLGGKVRLYNSYGDLLENKSRADLNMIYIGLDSQLIDINYYLKNIGKESISYMNVEGAIGDYCRKTFRGCIDFVSGCSLAFGEEKENCVLLSDDCRSKSLPQLLCGEENVVGSHGVSSGKVSMDRLFYLMTRGYSKSEAEKLIINGNFSKIINCIPDEEIQEVVEDKITQLLFL